MIIDFLWQPLFLNLLQNYMFRVFSPHRPYQELNMNKDTRFNVLRKTFTFIKTGDPLPIRPKLAPRSFPPAIPLHTDEETSSSSWKSNSLASLWWPHLSLAKPNGLGRCRAHHFHNRIDFAVWCIIPYCSNGKQDCFPPDWWQIENDHPFSRLALVCVCIRISPLANLLKVCWIK